MIFVVPLSDSYGRKPFLVMNAAIGTFAQAAFFLTSNLYVFYCLMFLIGLGAALNLCVGYVYIMEIQEKKHETSVISYSQIGEGVPTLVGPLYFMLLSNSWEPLIGIGTCVSAATMVLSYWVIESPRFLYAIKDTKKCAEACK